MNNLNPSPDCSENPFLRLKIPLTERDQGEEKDCSGKRD